MATTAPLTDLQAESELLDNIQAGNLTKVEEFVENFPLLRLCHGNRQVCALEYSIDCEKYEIYAYLRSKGFFTDKGEELNAKIQKLTDLEKEKIRVENLKHVVCNPEAFIGIILSKCSFDPQSPIASTDVREMLFKFKEINEINSMFPTIAYADFKTILDYVNKSVRTMDPNGDEFTLGQAYFDKGILYVGKNDSKNQRYGTFAHEMTHFLYYLIYENRCLPYCEDDTVREAEWVEVVRRVKQQYENNKETTDNIIKWVFTCYKSDYQQSAETAVRVNDMLAFYYDNDEKIEELVGLHPELFSFIREKVLPDLKIPNVYRMIKLNNDFGLIQKINDSKLQVKPTEHSEILNLTTEQSKKVLLSSNVPQLMLSKVHNEVKGLPGNKLNLKARNFFVDGKMLDQKHLNEEFIALLETTNVDRIIAVSSDFQELVNDLKPEVQYFFIATEVLELKAENLSFERYEIKIQWRDLTEKTQKLLLLKFITFQDNKIRLSKLLSDVENSISPEMLTILCSDDEIKVNCDSKVEKLVKFIERTVQMKKKVKVDEKKHFIMKLGMISDQENVIYEDENEPGTSSGSESKKVKFALIHEDFSLEDFITETQNKPILVISDVAGSGKTTLLTKIHEILTQKFPQHFIIFISLLKCVEELTESVGDSFTDFIAKILKFDLLERQIFMQKYSKGKVKILFDAFDEISPNCKQNTTKLFQLFDKNSKNQIFITTRTHLEHDLEKHLKVFAHRIKILTKEEQVKFLKESWENLDRDLVRKCANLLVDKISEIISSKPSVIGVPLILQGLAEAYKDKINENFEREIQNLDISSVYEKIVETSFKILSSRFPQKPVQNQEKTMSLPQAHQFVAICFLFSEELANSLGLNHDEHEWPQEELARCGLIKYDKDGKFNFNHQTCAEYFIAVFVFHLLKTVKKLSQVQLDFIFQVLTDKKFEITRMFLDSMLNRVDKVQDLKSFNSSREICKKVKCTKSFFDFFMPQSYRIEKNFLKFCAREKLFNIFEFFAFAVKKSDAKLFKEMIGLKNENEVTCLMFILPCATNLIKFENFLDEILNFYYGNIFDDFLLKVDKYGDTILHYFAANCKNSQVIECFWNKIKVLFANEAKLKSFLLVKGKYERNALLRSIARQNENTFYFLFEQVFSKFFNIKDFAYETAKHGENLLHHAASFTKSQEVFEFTWMKIEELIEDKEELKEFLLVKGYLERNALMWSIVQQNESSFYFLFEQVFCNFFNIKDFAYETDEKGNNLLHFLAAFGSDSMLKFALEKLKNELSPEEFHNFVKLKSKYGGNILHCAAKQNKNEKSVEFLVDFIENEFGSEEVKEMLSELSNFNYLPLHCAVGCNNLKVFEFFFSVYKQKFTKFEIESLIKNDFLHKTIFEYASGNEYTKEMFEAVKLALRDYHVGKNYRPIIVVSLLFLHYYFYFYYFT